MGDVKIFVQKHWAALAGGFVGLLVLYYIYENFAGASVSTPASTASIPSTSAGVAELSSAASLSNDQLNAQTEIASISGDVQNNQIAAALQASLAQTAATAANNSQTTSATEAVDLGSQNAGVSIQQIQSDAAVKQTAIESSTLESLAKTSGSTQVQVQLAKNQVGLAAAAVQSQAISTASDLITSGVLNKGGEGGTNQVAALATVTGQSPSAVVAATPKSTTPATISAVSSGVSSVLSGLFG